MKSKFISELKEQLIDVHASKKDIDEVLSDYEQLYDDALSSGKTDEETWQLLGDPKVIVRELRDTLERKKEKNIKTKVVAVMPFISLMIFFFLGFYQDMWHPGWLVFLSIPISAILFQTRLKEGIIALMPFLSVIAFLVLGWGFNLWHPGWLVFLMIPIAAILLNTKYPDVFVALSPFVATITFILLGHYANLWNPGWLIFLIIPMLGILHEPHKLKVLVYELSFIIAITFYIWMGYQHGFWAYGALGFILPLVVGILLGSIKINIFNLDEHALRERLIMFVVVVLVLILFVTLGYFLSGWAWAWQVFLIIPVFAIIKFDKFRLTAIMPFISVVIFYSLGYFLDLFHISWLAFLLIPITAIIENA